MEGRYALVNLATNLVENVIVYDPDGNWPIPDGYKLVQSDEAAIGDQYSNNGFVSAQ